MNYRIILIVLAVVVVLWLIASPVFAQETTVNLGNLVAPWVEYLVGLVAVLIGALVTYITALIKQRTGFEIEARHREAFQTALTNGAGLIIARGQQAAAGVTIDVRNAAVADAINYVNQAAPDAIRHWGITPNMIAEKLNAKLGLATAPTSPVPAQTGLYRS